MKTVNLEEGMPTVQEALFRLDRELHLSRSGGPKLIKLIHGYGSTGSGGEIRVAVQKRLQEWKDRGEIRDYVFGENWTKSDDASWKILSAHSGLKQDRDLGKNNRGITIVVL
jgi:hypothetical protein